jgi:hypothetical protein
MINQNISPMIEAASDAPGPAVLPPPTTPAPTAPPKPMTPFAPPSPDKSPSTCPNSDPDEEFETCTLPDRAFRV